MPSVSPLRIGTRKSVLALTQAEMVHARLAALLPGRPIEIVPYVTTGDIRTDRTLADIGGKGLFTKEIEEGLMRGTIDLAVHSLKDMETHLPPALIIAAVLEREDPRDAMIAKNGLLLAELPQGAVVGTASLRRASQLKIVRSDLEIVPLRGNVTTRIAKLHAEDGPLHAILLALAGLRRIGRETEITETLDTERFIPAAGQGTIAIECRADNHALRDTLHALNDAPTFAASLAERSLLATLDGSCRTPIGGCARMQAGGMRLDAMIALPDGTFHLSASRTGALEDAERMGRDAGEELLARGGGICIG